MLPTKVPSVVKWMYPSLTWESGNKEKGIFLTFDDGPHPEITPWVIEQLKEFNFKATFFCIGENVHKFPEIIELIKLNGHSLGNHTYNHLKGFKTEDTEYIHNIRKCNELVGSNLFRPPYGQIKRSQIEILKKQYRIIMWSLLVEDWNPNLNTGLKLKNLVHKSRPGNIIVFHDSQKAEKNLKAVLPEYLHFMKNEGYDALTF
ncbi:MAG: polysaccharide deacetylase family protein [Flavobacteriales bacterium]|nr:polysaccharide deacetylase family protein [Flavobacteriales bacterium]